jgi:hypothetical protein
MRRSIVVGAVLIAALGFQSGYAHAQALLTPTRIDEAGIAVSFPSDWQIVRNLNSVKALRASLKRVQYLRSVARLRARPSTAELRRALNEPLLDGTLLFAADPDNQDSIHVRLQQGVPDTISAKAWQAYTRNKAERLGSQVLSTAVFRVGGRKAFASIEEYPNGLVTGTMSIPMADRDESVLISITVDLDTRELAGQILNSVKG